MRDAVPPIWFLRDRAADVVVTKERCECGELHPPIAKFFVGVPYCGMEVGRHQCPRNLVLLRCLRVPKPQASAPTIGIWKSWNCNTPWMLWYKYDHLLQLSPSLRRCKVLGWYLLC